MSRRMEYGAWAQVIGTYDLDAHSGSILSMLPTRVAFASLEGGEHRVHLKGFGPEQEELFDLAVNPMTISCGVQGSERMFEEFVPVTDALIELRLFIDGREASSFAPGMARAPGRIALGQPSAGTLTKIPLEADVAPEPNVSYILQVRPDGDSRWHTMAVQLARPDATNLDINQFPGASALDVRILQSNGKDTSEVFRERREF